MATKPGDGKSNPFGNGQGGAMGGKSGATNFVTNPGGGGARSGPGMISQSRTQQPVKKDDLATESVPAGGPLPFSNPPADAGNPTGVGSVGNGAKPFKLGG